MAEPKPKLYISIEDAAKSILGFIGSDEYEDILSNITGEERGGFMTGLAISISILMNSGALVHGMPLEEVQSEEKSD